MPYVDRTVFTTNDQQSGEVADPNKLEANDSHLADVVDANYTELYDFVNGNNISKMGIVNVKDYGAVGDGSVDDTTSFKEAFDALEDGGVLYIPNGNYKLSSKLTISKKIAVIGQNQKQTVLNFVDTNGLLVNVSDVYFRDVRIYHTNTNTSKYTGVEINSGNTTHLERVNFFSVDISNFSTTLKVRKLWNFNFENLSLTFVGDIGLHAIGKSVNNQCNGLRIVSDTKNVPGSKGIYFDGSEESSEGWSLANTLIYGFETLIESERMSHVYLTNSILDYAGSKGVLLKSVNDNVSGGWQITNNYIAVDDGVSCIHDANNATQSNVAYGNIFSNNKIISYVSGIYGIVSDNNSFRNVITGNHIRDFSNKDIYVINDNSIISENICLSNITNNIDAKGIVTNNIGKVYYRRSTNYSKVGKIKISYDQSVPTTGTWNAGDIVYKVNPTEEGTSGSKYVVQGWRRITTGSGNSLNTDWFEMRTLTGN